MIGMNAAASFALNSVQNEQLDVTQTRIIETELVQAEKQLKRD